jgi:acyl-CoA thioesterase-2
MSSPVSELIELLSLERLENNLFRGQSRDIGTKYVFGGQVLGQALSAAQATLDSARGARDAHSLHAYFLRAGDIEHPIVYDVDRTRDGGSFSVRRVTAIQHGQPIFVCAASFQVHEDGAEHQLPMPQVPMPEDVAPTPTLSPEKLAQLPTKIQRWLNRMGPFEFRPIYPRDELSPPKRPPFQQVWFRLAERVGDAPELHRALLAYASDFHLLGTTTFPHGISYYQPNVQMASLDPVFDRQPERAERARPGARPDLRPRRPPDRQHLAGRHDPGPRQRHRQRQGRTLIPCARSSAAPASRTSNASPPCSTRTASKRA